MRAIFAACASAAMFLAPAAATAEGVDPLEAKVRTEDARRFVAVFEAAGGKPGAKALQAGYLDGAGRGVEVFTPDRIKDAGNLAKAVNARPQDYRRAIDVCLPAAEAATADLRAIYLALQGLLPNRPLPELHVVFGAGNSGGTAGPGAQVLGLEVICATSPTPEAIRAAFRHYFAHETVHTWQDAGPAAETDPLLVRVLAEGLADYIALLVTGAQPSPERAAWGLAREAELWAQFEADRALIKAALANGASPEKPTPEMEAAFYRWVSNYQNAPEGWPYEVGYWLGQRIVEAYVAKAEDKRAAIDGLLTLNDPAAILALSGYAERFAAR